MNSTFERFLQEKSHLSNCTQKCMRHWLGHFERFLSGWKAATATDLERYHQHLLWGAHSRGGLYSANTVDQGLRVVRTFFRWAVSLGLVRRDPCVHWKLPRPHQLEQPVLSHDKVLALLNLPDLSRPSGIRDALALELIYASPLTERQCLDLQVDQVVDRALVLDENRYPLDGTWPAMARYLEVARPRLAIKKSQVLLLSTHGGPMSTFQHRLSHYGPLMGLPQPLNARTLKRSYRAHILGLENRTLF